MFLIPAPILNGPAPLCFPSCNQFEHQHSQWSSLWTVIHLTREKWNLSVISVHFSFTMTMLGHLYIRLKRHLHFFLLGTVYWYLCPFSCRWLNFSCISDFSPASVILCVNTLCVFWRCLRCVVPFVFCSVAQSCPTLCNLVDCSHQAPLSVGLPRHKYWSGFPFSPPGDLPNPGNQTRTFCVGRRVLYHWATKEALCFAMQMFKFYTGRLFTFGSLPLDFASWLSAFSILGCKGGHPTFF